MRLVNCSQMRQPCEKHHVTGFPTVLAFRSHSSASSSCPQFCAGQGDCDLPVRQDYHGVLTVGFCTSAFLSVCPVVLQMQTLKELSFTG